jgi:hypothetical protein
MDYCKSLWHGLCAAVILASGQPLQLAEAESRQLLRRRCVFGRPMSKLILAVVRRRQERHAESLALLHEAEVGLAACDMLLHVACVRFRRGQWLGGTAGKELMRTGRDWMSTQGIRNPERMATMLVPTEK